MAALQQLLGPLQQPPRRVARRQTTPVQDRRDEDVGVVEVALGPVGSNHLAVDVLAVVVAVVAVVHLPQPLAAPVGRRLGRDRHLLERVQLVPAPLVVDLRRWDLQPHTLSVGRRPARLLDLFAVVLGTTTHFDLPVVAFQSYTALKL